MSGNTWVNFQEICLPTINWAGGTHTLGKGYKEHSN